VYNNRNTLVVSAAVVLATLVISVCAVVGNSIASKESGVTDRRDSDNLVVCSTQTTRSPADCRALIYGSN
jgi:hypothetical protein